VGAVYVLALRQLSGRWRLIIMAVLATLPVIITIPIISDNRNPSVAEFEVVVLSSMLMGSIVPLVVLAIAGAAFANEIDDKTLANLTLSPIPRWQIVVPKFLACVTMAGPFAAVSAAVTTHAAFLGDARATIAVTIGAVLGVALYAAAFVFLGLLTTQAIGLGLLYIVLWEGFVSGFVAGARLLSIRHYSLGLMHALDARRFLEQDVLPPLAAVIVSSIVVGGFLFLAVRRLKRMDVP
jgi:ABC-2 type transport system permease protein